MTFLSATLAARSSRKVGRGGALARARRRMEEVGMNQKLAAFHVLENARADCEHLLRGRNGICQAANDAKSS